MTHEDGLEIVKIGETKAPADNSVSIVEDKIFDKIVGFAFHHSGFNFYKVERDFYRKMYNLMKELEIVQIDAILLSKDVPETGMNHFGQRSYNKIDVLPDWNDDNITPEIRIKIHEIMANYQVFRIHLNLNPFYSENEND